MTRRLRSLSQGPEAPTERRSQNRRCASPAAQEPSRTPERARTTDSPLRRALLVPVLVPATLLSGAMPRLAGAVSDTDWPGWSTVSTPADQALAGGVVSLRSAGPRMLLVPRGTFMAGSSDKDVLAASASCAREPWAERCSPELFSDERPRHRVTLAPYWLDRTEVTVAQHRRCADLGACTRLPVSLRSDPPRLPVGRVSFADAEDYCRFAGGRLPTEAEWERAARGVTERRYPWGALYNSHAANHGRFGAIRTDDRDGFVERAPVGSFPAGRTPEGFLDLAGNVSEWVDAYYSAGYQPSTVAARGTSSNRVVRGGDFMSAAPWLRGASRCALPPLTRLPRVGFRCARTAGR
jgi:formylglycine-generating enzyme